MSLFGTLLTVLIGPTAPAVASPTLMLALRSITVEHNDEGRSGFQMVLGIGRNETTGLLDYDLVADPNLVPFSRVVLVVTLGGIPQVLFDGLITQVEVNPSNDPGASTLTVTGEDVSVMMDLKEQNLEHPAQPEMTIVATILAQYAQFGLVPVLTSPTSVDVPVPTERVPTQQGTDLQFIQQLAERFGFVFYVKPGPMPLTNQAVWGPRERTGVAQPALSYNMGSASNVRSMDFQQEGLSATLVAGQIQDRMTNQAVPVQTFSSTRVPLAAVPTAVAFFDKLPTTIPRESGLTAAQALARAQGLTDASSESTITATGELDAARYGTILQARGLVDVRGAGWSYNGRYYVKSVTHEITPGSYLQKFTLTRDGIGSTVALAGQ